MTKQNKHNKNGYTLIEILVVIGIIGFIASAAMYFYNDSRVKSRDAKRLADISTIQKALEMHYDGNDGYPGSDSTWYQNDSCDNTLETKVDLSDVLVTTYISEIPNDPNNNTTRCYWYQRLNSGTGFILLMKPENQSIVSDGMNCATVDVPGSGNPNDWYCIGENW